MKIFSHLHCHSEYSILKGFGEVEKWIAEAKKRGIKALSFTEYGNMGSSFAAFLAAKEAGIKYIFGLQISAAQNIEATNLQEEPIILLAKNESGFKNLLKISKFSWTEGFDNKLNIPRVTYDYLNTHKKGLIALTGSLSGPIAVSLSAGYNVAYEAFKELKDIFGKNLYAEIQLNEFPEQKNYNQALIRMSRSLGVTCVLTNDCHFINEGEHELVKTSVAIAQARLTQAYKKDVNISYQKWFKSLEELEIFRKKAHSYITQEHFEELVKNTNRVAELCDFELTIGHHSLPTFDIKTHLLYDESIENNYDLFYKIARSGFKEKIKNDPQRSKKIKEYKKRFKYELSVIKAANFIDYFLIVEDIIRWAKLNDIEVGAARGCLVGDTNIILEGGVSKPIKNVDIGEYAITREGTVEEIVDKFVYDIKEDLIKFKSYYGDFSDNGFTKDHIIFGQKVIRPNGFDNWSYTTKNSKRNFLDLEDKIEEIKCEDLRIGDFVWTPFIKRKVITDFSLEFYKNIDGYNEICGDKIIERVPINKSYDFSIREVSKFSGVSRNFIVDTILCDKKIHTIRQKKSYEKLVEYLSDNNFTIKSWKKYIAENSYKTQVIKKEQKVDEETAWVIGRWIADGWTRSSEQHNRIWGICFGKSKKRDFIRVKKWLRSLGVTFNEKEGKSVYAINVSCGVFTRTWKKLFSNYKHEAHTKYIPNELKTLGKKYIRSLINGMIATRERSVSYSTTSFNLANDLRYLLNLLKIPSSIGDRFDAENYSVNHEYTVRFVDNPNKGMSANSRCYLTDDGYFSRIYDIKIDKNVKTKVYDLQIKHNHSYLTSKCAVHNSVAGSIIAFCMDITDVDPIQFDLLFERFLNPARISGERAKSADALPDIDLDFERIRRPEIKEYIIKKYGSDRVCTIGSYQTMKMRGLLRDLHRVFDGNFPDENGNTKHFSMESLNALCRELEFEKIETLDDAKNKSQKFKDFYDEYKYFVDFYCQRLTKQIKAVSRHAAGVLITPSNITDWIPVRTQKIKEDEDSEVSERVLVSQWEDVFCERRGLLKLDILGIKTLNIIKETKKLIEKRYGKKIDVNKIPLNDKKVYKEFSYGNTEGDFQFNSNLQSNYLRQLKPDEFEDLIATNALLRPGPMDSKAHEKYIELKHGEAIPEYDHELLVPYLKKTHGLYIYQEQIMTTAHVLGKLTLAEADIMRSAIKKFDREKMLVFENKFIKGAMENGLSQHNSEAVWEKLLAFSGYGFNRCLVGDTKILLKDGKELNIDTMFRRYKELGQQFVIKSFDMKTQRIVDNKVRRIIYTGKKHLWKLVLETNNDLYCTTYHRIGTERGFRIIADLKIDDRIFCIPKKTKDFFMTSPIKECEIFTDSFTLRTYDIEMEDEPRNYFANGILVHNSHSASYALLGYRCQWLKTHFPLEFWTSTLEFASDDVKKNENIWYFKKVIEREGIKFERPFAARNKSKFFITKKSKIAWPIRAIKGVGIKAANETAKVCKEKKPKSFEEFFDIVPKRLVNKRVFEKLIASDSFYKYCNQYEAAQKYYSLRKEELPSVFNIPENDKETWETIRDEALGFQVTSYKERYSGWFHREVVNFDVFLKANENDTLIVGGKVSSFKPFNSKWGKIAFMKILDIDGEILCFITSNYMKLADKKKITLPKVGDIVEVYGLRRWSNRGEPEIFVDGFNGLDSIMIFNQEDYLIKMLGKDHG